MKDNFHPSLAEVLQHEGGFVDDPRDPGGRTNRGITQVVYDDWRYEHGQPMNDVKNIDINEVEAIYKRRYWDAVRGDDLPNGVDFCVFDFAVNSGVSRAVRYLQRAAGVVDDGQIGPVTMAAVNAAHPEKLIDDISLARQAFLEGLPTFPRFGRGWLARVADVQMSAEAMAA